MGQITLRPELVTSSGEACGIMLDDQYVGSLTLLYREADRIWGAVQLDEDVLTVDEKEEVDLFIHQYVENMIDAAGAVECFITTTYSPYDHVISTDQVGHVEELVEVESNELPDGYEDYEALEDDVDTFYEYDDLGEDDFDEGIDYEYVDDLSDEDEYELDEYDLAEFDNGVYDDVYLEEDDEDLALQIVGESRNRVEYQLLDQYNNILAEAIMYIDRTDVLGDIFFHENPSEESIDEVTHVLVSDFDQDLIDSFEFRMFFDDVEIANIELTHEDLIEEEDVYDDDMMFEEDVYIDDGYNIEDDEGYETAYIDGERDLYVDVYEDERVRLHFELIRDDIDTITFDIYEDGRRRSTRLGMATVDLAGEPSALIDFINPRDAHLRQQVAYQLMEELDKETDYNTFGVTMQYQGDIIDEYTFDIEDQREELVYT
ncbi:hypothetical protein [Caldalkalibacillus salinus]|uniref:hypothetical protein n=1 Tax=Caldalkalibacillus salinus TaxID=2803787 RepID=UPI001920A812|nr:hypothetical protein [Caldalkalibacillus salinus]